MNEHHVINCFSTAENILEHMQLIDIQGELLGPHIHLTMSLHKDQIDSSLPGVLLILNPKYPYIQD
jgi:hypothetical protein